MPTISAFHGIAVRMYYDDHFPPHFHALYQGDEAKVAIATLEILGGGLPQRMMRYVLSWAGSHRSELQENWERAQQHGRLVDVPPPE
jgi:hypothetical protein